MEAKEELCAEMRADPSLKAERFDAPMVTSPNYPASCAGCCSDDEVEERELRAIVSLLEVIEEELESCCESAGSSFEFIESQIEELTEFSEFCCFITNSNIDSLTQLQESCCESAGSSFDSLSSKIEDLTNLEVSCCESAGSSFDFIESQIDELTLFDQSCCTVTNSKLDSLSTFEQSCCTYTNSNINVLTSIVDTIATGGCTFEIGAAEIAAGVVIKDPGVYCIVEDGTSVGTAIYVATSNVFIDFGRHTITVPNGQIGVYIDSIDVNTSGPLSNVVVKGGSIVGAASAGYGIYTGADDVSISQMRLIGPDTGIFINSGSRITMSDVFYSNNTSGTGALVTNIFGSPFDIVVTSFEASGAGMHLINVARCSMIDVLVENANSEGLWFTNCRNVSMENCRSVECARNGLFIEGLSSTQYLIDGCAFEANQQNGVFVNANFGDAASDIIFESCSSIGNVGGSGFLIYNDGGINNIHTVIFESCISNSNARTGFLIDSGSGYDITDILFRNCIANNNAGEGIFLSNSVLESELLRNVTANNGGYGIYINAPSDTANVMYGNSSYNNSAANYFGSGVYFYLVLNPSQTAGAWTNADPTAAIAP